MASMSAAANDAGYQSDNVANEDEEVDSPVEKLREDVEDRGQLLQQQQNRHQSHKVRRNIVFMKSIRFFRVWLVNSWNRHYISDRKDDNT